MQRTAHIFVPIIREFEGTVFCSGLEIYVREGVGVAGLGTDGFHRCCDSLLIVILCCDSVIL